MVIADIEKNNMHRMATLEKKYGEKRQIVNNSHQNVCGDEKNSILYVVSHPVFTFYD